MRTEAEIRQQLTKAYGLLKDIEKNIPSGNCYWRMEKRYIDGLHYALGED